MRSKLSAMTALTPRRFVPFAAQSREEPCAILLAAEDDERRAFLLVGHGRIEDRGLLPVGPQRVAALDPVEHLVLDTDVGEGAAHHDLVVAPARAVGVELPHRHLPFHR
jgi:hypothetical protein